MTQPFKMFLGAVALLVLLFVLAGCTPTYLDAALVHESHPFAGPGPAPFGGPGDETTRDSVEGTAGWERATVGHALLIWDGTVGYTLRERRDEGGPWMARFRVGVRVRL